ncbi:MAG: glycosyltransferase family 4 protein [Muribaculaceae bacterium]|nr:glycosyltransferase family 4 protein [Muribaculaceae bacterium]
MKICHVLWGLTYGGIETMIINIANEQTALGHEVHLLVVNDMFEDSLIDKIDKNVTLHKIGRKVGSKNPLPIVKLNFMIWRMAPDVVHFHEAGLNSWVKDFVLKASCTTHHNDHVSHLAPFIKKRPNFFSVSNVVGKLIKEATGYDTTVVVNGIDTSRFTRKSSYYKGGAVFRIIQVGRLLTVHKGQDILVEAARMLRDRGVAVQIDIVGPGPSEAELASLISRYDLSDTVTLTGPRTPEYLAQHLADYDLFVHPSRFEAFGLAIVEAMAAGVPVLVSDVEAQMEVIDDGACGYFFKNGDPASLADMIEYVMADYDLAKVDNALRRVADHYDVRATAARYIDEYARLK